MSEVSEELGTTWGGGEGTSRGTAGCAGGKGDTREIRRGGGGFFVFDFDVHGILVGVGRSLEGAIIVIGVWAVTMKIKDEWMEGDGGGFIVLGFSWNVDIFEFLPEDQLGVVFF